MTYVINSVVLKYMLYRRNQNRKYPTSRKQWNVWFHNAVNDEAFDTMAQVEFDAGVAQVLNMRLCIVNVAKFHIVG